MSENRRSLATPWIGELPGLVIPVAIASCESAIATCAVPIACTGVRWMGEPTAQGFTFLGGYMASHRIEVDLSLEYDCGNCHNGISYVTGGKCEDCNGYGSFLTELGYDVLDLVKRRLLDKKEGQE
jgi:hypothetical protein